MDVLPEHILMLVLHERETKDVLRKLKDESEASDDDEVWVELDLATAMRRSAVNYYIGYNE
jgi:hypothetical protein